MEPKNSWTDTTACPFCGGGLASPGTGFIDHLDENPDCAGEFEAWRDAVSDDMRGGWPG